MKTSTLACLCLGAWCSFLWTNAQQTSDIKHLTEKVEILEKTLQEKK